MKSSSRVERVAPRSGVRGECAPAWISGEEGGQFFGRGEPLDLGFVEGSRELLGGEDVGEVDERAGGGGDADAVVGGGVWVGRAVDVDAGAAVLGRCRHFGQRGPPGHDPPQRRGGAVAQHRVIAAREDRRHCRGERRWWAVTHGVDPAVKEVQTSDANAVLDRARTEPELQQLRVRHHAMLPRRQFGQRDVGCGQLGLTMRLKRPHPAHNRASPPPNGAPRAFRHISMRSSSQTAAAHMESTI